MGSMVGASVTRKEDPSLLTGHGTYVDDLNLPGMVHMAYVRSTEPHARIVSVDCSEAAAMDGVLGVWTAEDLADLPPFPSLPGCERRLLATGKVHYVGEPVAVVVATDRYKAADAAEAVEIDYDPLPAVPGIEAALAADAPKIFEAGNVVLTQQMTSEEDDADAVERLAAAPRRMTLRLVNQRCAGAPIEPFGVVADADRATTGLTLWASIQAPHWVRGIVSESLGLTRDQVRVIAPDVGGGFGVKGSFYPELVIAPELSRRLRRPVKYVETRTENMVHTTHGRDQVQDVEVGYDDDGHILVLKAVITVNAGGWPDPGGAGLPELTCYMAGGCYAIPRLSAGFRAVATNTTPTAAYRGAGRPEAAFLIERVVDTIAHTLGRDPVDVRRANFIQSGQMPYQTQYPTIVYDEADYPRALDVLLSHLDYKVLRDEQAARREEDNTKLLGIGFSTFVEMGGFGPSGMMENAGFLAGWESANVRVQPDGSVVVATGTSPHGQGHETTFAQIVSDVLGVPFERITVQHGDTAAIQEGIGTFGSRSVAVGGSAVHKAAQKVSEQAKKIAAHMLEADPGDLEPAEDGFRVKGTASSVPFADVALRSFKPHLLPGGAELGLEATFYYEPANLSYPSGAHACVVEVDTETGDTNILRYVAVDDCGKVINPLLARGQIHGGLAQGIAQALYEKVSYSPEGQPLTSTLVDYLVPGALDLPAFESHHIETPTSFNPLGAKGIGESGATAAPPAVVNAVVDALAHLGVRDIEMPCTPERVWAAIHGGEA